MSLFNLPIPLKQKIFTRHPWEATIKDNNANKIRYAHNSVNNPHYPKKKEKSCNKDRVKFTIIGNRCAKEFIHCINLVKGIHKYKWKLYDTPVIRGVTSVEWPAVLNDLKIQFGGLAFCLGSPVVVLINDRLLGGDKELKEFINAKYYYHLSLNYVKEGVAQFANFIKTSGRPCAYMHISIDDVHVGTLIFMLYADIVPNTCENFLRLCKERKGGYSGTPVHRIVKDGWIQCGGFGLKSTDLNCENFIVPHDRRGVLGMANDGRHVDCSTQFFVSLQPMPWMAFNYVAFGQLIDGEATLKMIENVPTRYESPKQNIVIHQAGILNIDCQDIAINKCIHEYIQGHIENLYTLGEWLFELLWERVTLQIELRLLECLEIALCPEEPDLSTHSLRNLKSSKSMKSSKTISKIKSSRHTRKSSVSTKFFEEENTDFDVENCDYEYEPEETPYEHISLPATASVVIKPDVPYYLALTDVPYPGEIDSTYDLKKFLRGDYCFEGDLIDDKPDVPQRLPSNVSEFGYFDSEDFEYESDKSLDSEEEMEIQRYLQQHMARVSFAGGVVKTIAKRMSKPLTFDEARKSEYITDEMLRRLRTAANRRKSQNSRKVVINIEEEPEKPSKLIRRRPTGFIRAEDIASMDKIREIKQRISEMEEAEEEGSHGRKVRIKMSSIKSAPKLATDFKEKSLLFSQRESGFGRLLGECARNEDDTPPTLKNYKPLAERPRQHMLLLTSHLLRNIEEPRGKLSRHSLNTENSLDQMLTMQYGKNFDRKMSTEYVKTFDQARHKTENSIRSLEYAKTRPSMSVSEYQMRNRQYEKKLKTYNSETSMRLIPG